MNKCKKVRLNLIQADVYARHPEMLQTVAHSPAPQKYYELVKKVTPYGEVEGVVEKDYPITQDYVASYASGVDYKRDLETAMSAPKKSAGLGDVTSIQELMAMDTSAVRAMLDKVDSLKKAQSAASAAAAQEPKQEPKQETKKEGD